MLHVTDPTPTISKPLTLAPNQFVQLVGLVMSDRERAMEMGNYDVCIKGPHD